MLIHWARAYFARGPHRHGHLRCALLLVRFTSVVITLHLLQILLWTAFYRWNCNRSRTLASGAELATRNTSFLVNPEKNLTVFRRIYVSVTASLQATLVLVRWDGILRCILRGVAGAQNPAGLRLGEAGCSSIGSHLEKLHENGPS